MSVAAMGDVMVKDGACDDRAKLARMACRLNARHAGGRLGGLVLMTDDALDAHWIDAVEALPRGSCVVVRHRDATARARLGRQLLAACRRRGVKLIVADDVKLAHRLGADGVHLPEARTACATAVRRANRRWVVTSSAHDARGLAKVRTQRPDGVFVSPVFATASHAGAAGLGVTRFMALAHRAALPVHALGGITGSTAQRLVGLPLAGLALIRGWVGGTA